MHDDRAALPAAGLTRPALFSYVCLKIRKFESQLRHRANMKNNLVFWLSLASLDHVADVTIGMGRNRLRKHLTVNIQRGGHEDRFFVVRRRNEIHFLRLSRMIIMKSHNFLLLSESCRECASDALRSPHESWDHPSRAEYAPSQDVLVIRPQPEFPVGS
jgi:hypothetical protein